MRVKWVKVWVLRRCIITVCLRVLLSSLLSWLGMDPHKFTSFGRKVQQDPSLQRRVVKEAQLIKLASKLKHALRRDFAPRLQGSGEYPFVVGETQRFALCLDAIEKARHQLRDQLKTQMRVSELPANLCSEASRSLLSPRVQEACQQFPDAAKDIIRKHGFTVQQFSKLYHRYEWPWHQWKLRWNLRKIREAES